MIADTGKTPPPDNPPHSVMERITELDERVSVLEKALTRAYGKKWLDAVKAAHDD